MSSSSVDQSVVVAQAEIEKQEAKVKDAKTEVKEAKEGVKEAETKVEKAREEVKQAEIKVKEAETKVEKAESKVKETQTGTEWEKATAQKGLESAQKGLDSAQKGLDSAQKGLDLAQEGVNTAQRLCNVAVTSLERASGAVGGAQAASRQGTGGDQVTGEQEFVTGDASVNKTIVRELQRLSRQVERLQVVAHTSPSFRFLPSSAHDPKFLDEVVEYYHHGRRCCLTGTLDPGQGLAEIDRVHASHIIQTSDPGLLLEINNAHPDKEFLTPQSPRNAILLQRKWEILFDLRCWCLFPADLFSQTPNFKVCVFATTAGMAFLQASVKRPFPLQQWIEDLRNFDQKTIIFPENQAPSFRALSAHALQTVQFAQAMRWIPNDSAEDYAAFADLSRLHSTSVSLDDAIDNEFHI